MEPFTSIRRVRVLQKKHLPFLKTLEDFDMVLEIGYYEETGNPVNLKLLLALKIGSVATMQRRLARLKCLGVVKQVRASHDKRNLLLTISPEVREIYRKVCLGSLIEERKSRHEGKAWRAHRSGAGSRTGEAKPIPATQTSARP
jgi:DNA-binding MarR family transcriptional regulator